MEVYIAILIHVGEEAAGHRLGLGAAGVGALQEEPEVLQIDHAIPGHVARPWIGNAAKSHKIPARHAVLDRRPGAEADTRIGRRVETLGDTFVDDLPVDREDVRSGRGRVVKLEAEQVGDPLRKISKHERKLRITQKAHSVTSDSEVVENTRCPARNDHRGGHGAERLRARRQDNPFEIPRVKTGLVVQLAAVKITSCTFRGTRQDDGRLKEPPPVKPAFRRKKCVEVNPGVPGFLRKGVCVV